MAMARKFEDVYQDLTVLKNQGNVKGFLNNAQNASKLQGLLEDVRDAIIEYQVRTSLDYIASQGLTF